MAFILLIIINIQRGSLFLGEEAYGTAVVAAAAGSKNFRVG